MNFCFRFAKNASAIYNLAGKAAKSNISSSKSIHNTFKFSKSYIEAASAMGSFAGLTSSIGLLAVTNNVAGATSLMGLVEDGDDDDAGC